MAPTSPDWLHEIDHTGDIGIQVAAGSLEQLFARVALGMFWVLTDLDGVQAQETAFLSVEARDYEALMVRWLSDLNFRHTVDHQLYCNFEVEVLEEGKEGLTLQATCHGESIDHDRHTVHTEIKAITFHGLDVHQTDDGWAVQVIFDM